MFAPGYRLAQQEQGGALMGARRAHRDELEVGLGHARRAVRLRRGVGRERDRLGPAVGAQAEARAAAHPAQVRGAGPDRVGPQGAVDPKMLARLVEEREQR